MQQRRAFFVLGLRFSGCEEDLSHKPPDAPFQTSSHQGRSRLSSSLPSPANDNALKKVRGNIWPCASVTQALPRKVSSSRFSGQCQENNASLWR